MSNRSFDSIVPRIQASVPGCPHATIVQYIRDAAIRTCERTLAWRHQVPLFNLLPGVHEYFYNKPENTDVHAVFEAVVNNRPLKRLTLEEAITLYPQWADLYGGQDFSSLWCSTPSGGINNFEFNCGLFNENPPFRGSINGSTPRFITQITPDKYIVLPLPDDKIPYCCRMFVALKPKRTATGMDAAIFDDLEEVIMHGALQHLLVLPNQAWSDRELAAYHAKQYVFQIAERRARANLGNVRGTLRVRMQPFGV